MQKHHPVALACTTERGFYFCSKCKGFGYIDDRGWPTAGQPFFSCEACPECYAAYEMLTIAYDTDSRGYFLRGTFEDYAWADNESAVEACAFEVVAQNKMRHPDGPNWPAVDDAQKA